MERKSSLRSQLEFVILGVVLLWNTHILSDLGILPIPVASGIFWICINFEVAGVINLIVTLSQYASQRYGHKNEKGVGKEDDLRVNMAAEKGSNQG